MAILLKKLGVTLPSWVEVATDKKKAIRNIEKLRKNRTVVAKEEKVEPAEAKAEESVEEKTIEPAEEQTVEESAKEITEESEKTEAMEAAEPESNKESVEITADQPEVATKEHEPTKDK